MVDQAHGEVERRLRALYHVAEGLNELHNALALIRGHHARLVSALVNVSPDYHLFVSHLLIALL